MMMKQKKQELPAEDANTSILNRWEVELVRSIETGIL
jgi:hypothetical protein